MCLPTVAPLCREHPSLQVSPTSPGTPDSTGAGSPHQALGALLGDLQCLKAWGEPQGAPKPEWTLPQDFVITPRSTRFRRKLGQSTINGERSSRVEVQDSF